MTERNKNNHRYALFLGCLIPARFPRFEYLARRLFPELGIELVDLDGFSFHFDTLPRMYHDARDGKPGAREEP
ncbi:MAG: hypothetical protein JRC86_04015 [Deltaproteobacteria bacterium]|nr:hypothetical protein [Deltaproteobacteria bacterium]